MVAGLVGNIQHYSIHDGPGIRSTVFLKGCPLCCGWCHNPENLSFQPQLRWQQEKCLACGACVAACPKQAVCLTPGGVSINTDLCALCGACVTACPTLAMELLGKNMSVAEVLATLKKDALFYESSGGGVTISGGEPLSQPEFTAALLKALKQEGIHTALDTSGHARMPALAPCVEHTDLFLYDIKHLDPLRHEQLTGVDNALILSNLRSLSRQGCLIWLRVPLLPGLNDAPRHIEAIGTLARELGIREIYLLPYHHMAMSKYEKLGLTYRLPNLAEPSQQHMEELQRILLKMGLNSHVGG